MAQEKTTSFRNSVRLVGYLKETTLDERVSQSGRHFITGKVTIALDEFNTHRVSFLVFKEDNAEKYEALSKFLPNNTVSIASYLKSTPTANFATASNMAAKVWAMAAFEEFVSRSGEKEKTMVNLKGFSMGLMDPEKSFVPTATFEIDCYMEKIEEEVENDKPTGRLLMDVILPAYKGLVYRIPLVAPVEDNVAKYIKAKYKVGDTSRLQGNLVAMRVQIENNSEEEPEYFGKPTEQQFTTRFVRENVIIRGSKDPIHQGEQGSITNEMVKNGLTIREKVMDENGQRKNNNSSSKAVEPETATEEAAEVVEIQTTKSEDFDF